MSSKYFSFDILSSLYYFRTVGTIGVNAFRGTALRTVTFGG